MATVKNSRVGMGLHKDGLGKYSVVGALDSFPLSDTFLTFVFIVYWDGDDGETFRQSFSLVDDVGNILDTTSETNYVLSRESENIGVAYFDATVCHAGKYFVKVYQDRLCTETIPLDIVQPGSNTTELLR
jgi:hypothetical protein